MSGTVPIDTAWAQEAIRRKSEGQESADIAIAVGKNAATVRKVLKAAREAGVLSESPLEAVATNGNGHHDEGSIPEDGDNDEPYHAGSVREAEAETPAPAVADEYTYLEEIRVDGTTQLGMFDAGGHKPDGSSLRLSGGRIQLVDGKAFRKGDVIRFEGTAVMREVAQRDTPDPKTGVVVSTEQKHVAQITDLRVV